METKAKSSSLVKTTPKPVNVFYVWYTELCRRLSINPAPAVKPAKPKCQTVLDFVADRLKIEEWSPLLNALRQDTSLHVVAVRSRIGNAQFLHEIDTEEKARAVKRKCGYIWTAYVLNQLVKSISNSLRITQVLTYLELDGLPMFMEYLEPLLQALKRNQTLKNLSLSNCAIQDAGCQLVCSYLRFTPNIEVLNLSGCSLSPVSGEHIAKLIKYQQINRYCESWHSSLRYENPDAGKMRGIKRITMNRNPLFQNSGLLHILEELEDDLWIKALDLQKCNITEDVIDRVLEILHYNKTLEILDVRHNDELSLSTVEKIFQILKERQPFGDSLEYQWCDTAVTLARSSLYSPTSRASMSIIARSVHKTKSAPMKPATSKTTWDQSARRTQTLDSFQKQQSSSFKTITDSKKQVLELNNKLQKEIEKRKRIEKDNERLRSQLSNIKTTESVHNVTKRHSVSVDRGQVNGVKKELHVKKVEIRSSKTKEVIENTALVVRRKELKAGTKNGVHRNGVINGHKNGITKVTTSNVYDILEKLLSAGKPMDKNEEEEMLSYFVPTTQQHENLKQVEPISMSNSEASLYQYMTDLKKQGT